ncbi:MAG: hypothetical protein OXU73_01370 [Candidatus Campbellbacteria bacterium]|nr:hypothetical protein [Candidatus Campbellbacteria bacterium]
MSHNYHSAHNRILSILDESGCLYDRFEHIPVVTSEEAAQVRPNEYSIEDSAKSLIVKARNNDKRTTFFVQLVIPGDDRFKEKRVAKLLGATEVTLASLEELDKLTDGLEPGSIPPFGTLFNIPVYIDTITANRPRIVFNCADRRVSVAVDTSDYLKIVRPNICIIV